MIFRIFRDDLKSAVKYFFTFVVIIAICVIPSLYAWINIYANQDPYVNTGNLPVAVASRDQGITLDNGDYVNKASDVTASLKDNKKIKWQFPGSAEEAVEGAKAGKYYAAIVFEKDFTYDMYHFDETLLKDDYTITYYSNAKKNAVAAKITDTAAENLLDTINTQYLETVFGKVFEGAGKLGRKLDSDKAVDKALARLTKLRDDLRGYDKAIDSFTDDNSQLKKLLGDMENRLKDRESREKEALTSTGTKLEGARESVDAISEILKDKAGVIEKNIDKLEENIDKLRSMHDKEKAGRLMKKAAKAAGRVLFALQQIRSFIPDDARLSGVRILADVLDLMAVRTEGLKTALEKGPLDTRSAENTLTQLKTLLKKDLTPDIDIVVSGLDSSLDMAEPLLTSAGRMLDDIQPVLGAAGDTVTSLDTALAPLQKVFRASADGVDEIINKVRGEDKDKRAAMLLKLMGGDPDKYSRFFTSMVSVRLETVYPEKPYGNAMTPFYTILAIWVGGVILASVLRARVDRKKYPQATETQCFFGRFLLFFLLGQIQAAIITAGDIFLLGVTPVHPALMFLTAGIASLVFTMLIYALVLGFGDVGKGIVVVIMVLQISGSGGSYPIEILPGIYDKIYTFFPFPYAINAMREAIYGLYGNDMIIYLVQLMIFGVIGMIIGLFVRKPFIGMNRFVTEKLEDTEVL